MHPDFIRLLNQLGRKRPSTKRGDVDVFHYKGHGKGHEVILQSGEMFDIHWVDIQIELPRFRADNVNTAKKLLTANREMGAATAIPSWFAWGDRAEVLAADGVDGEDLGRGDVREGVCQRAVVP